MTEQALHSQFSASPHKTMPPMKYFVISYRYTAGEKYNLGDNIQSIAVEHLLRSIGISSSAIDSLNRDELALPSRHRGIAIIQGWFGCQPGTFPLPIYDKGVIPLFYGFHLNEGSWEYLAGNRTFLESMTKHAPIGCRDIGTRDFLRSLGIKAYYSGCLTLTLPRRQGAGKPDGIYLIDPLDDIEAHLPAALYDKVIRLRQEDCFPSGLIPISYQDVATVHAMARQRLAQIRDQASLVVTRRLHIALPCLAMGVPVIFTFGQPENPRVSMLRNFLPIYSRDKYPSINWSPLPPDVEQEKTTMTMVFCHRLQTLEHQSGYWTSRLTDDESARSAAWLDTACQPDSGTPAYSLASYSRTRFVESAFTPEQQAKLASGSPLVLFGAGAAGLRLRKIIEFFGLTVHRYCDNSVNTEDARSLDGLSIISFHHLLTEASKSIVFISTLAGFDSIKAQLLAAGFPPTQIAGSWQLINDFSHFVVPSESPLGSPGHAAT